MFIPYVLNFRTRNHYQPGRTLTVSGLSDGNRVRNCNLPVPCHTDRAGLHLTELFLLDYFPCKIKITNLKANLN